MSASYKDRDGSVYFPHRLNQFEESMFCMQFDAQVEFDILDIKQEMKENKLLRRVCLYKILLFIPEFLLTFCLFGFKTSTLRMTETKLYWKFLRKQISYEKFEKDLTKLTKSGKIG